MRLALRRTGRQCHERIDGAARSESRRVHGWMNCVLLFLLCSTQAAPAPAGSAPTVLVLYDGGREFASIQLMDRAIESTLNAAFANRITIFREYMDLTRVEPTNYAEVLRNFYRTKYSGNTPDVILAIRGRTLDFLLKRGDELFPRVPIVSSGMDLRQLKELRLPPDVTGNALNVRYWPTIKFALTLQPETDQIVVVGGASLNDRALQALVRDEFRDREQQIRFNYLVGLSESALLQRVAQLPPHAVLLFVSFAQDAEGRSFMPNEVLTRIARAASAPTYIASDDVLDCDAVGGDLISFASLGGDSARLALRILRGESPSHIPLMETSERVKVVDARQLKRWGIALARVPPGTVILNRVPTAWEQYRGRIVGGIALIVLQSGLITALLIHRRRRRMAEQSLLVSEARRHTAVLEERNRLARDMHDTLAQGFTGVIVQLEAAKAAFVHGATADTDAHFHRASELARQSLGEARRSIRALRSLALESGDLCAALDGAMKQMTAGTRFHVEFTTHGRPRKLMPSIEENLLRIHQEILTNALKHSRAKLIKAALSFEKDIVRLQVQDDGVGFDMTRKHEGLGLIGIRERVSQMNGELSVEGAPGFGVRICVVLPGEDASGQSALGQRNADDK
jgi:signal transduction histidine kinase